jgi:transposase-like protein
MTTKEETITAESGTLEDFLNPKQMKKELKRRIYQEGGTKNFLSGKSLIDGITKSALEALLEIELEEHLGYAKHQATGKGSGNSRNGTAKKKVRGNFGELEVEVPRDREGTFAPAIVPKRQKDLGNFTDKIISLYTRGMTTREIQQHLEEIYDIEVSAQFVSRATERIKELLDDWQARPLDPIYPVVYVDGLWIKVRLNGTIQKRCVYVVLGITCEGKPEVLGLWIAQSESAKFWMKVLNDLKARGVEDILILCGDGLKGLNSAVEAVFPPTDLQLCVVHQIRNATRFVSYVDRRDFCADMREIYAAPTVEAAAKALDALEEKWGKRYPSAVKSWRTHWEALTTFFQYPVELRKLVYTTNAIESLNAQLRKNSRNRKVFPSDESALKLLFLNVQNITERWTKRRNWDIVMNQLVVLFEDRITPHLNEDF